MWAKISPPILPDLIHRERLHRRLESCFRGCATWVGGPAGCGKTSIVASFVRQRQQPCLWYRVDEGDNDPGCSFQWLAAAAGRLATGVAGPELPALTPERVAGLPSFARTFVRALDERLPDSCVLVFDNVQEVDDDAFFYTLIRTALREFTPGKHVVLISRSTPHRLFATFSAARELSVVDWSDLRFTGEEARELVSLLLGRQDPAHADGLQAIADGWAAGLTLLSRCPRPLVEAADGATPRHPPVPGVLFDYFATEFLRSLDEPLQQFLLRTAFAPMLTPAMAQVLSGREDAEKLLGTLHQRNWLIVRREDHIHAYEYHPLFRQFLCDYTCATWRPTDVAELKRSTAAALEAAGDGEAAMDLFLDLQDWASVERILADCGPALAERARYRTLGLWLRRVPAEALRARPWLRYWMGVAEVPVSTAAALETFSDCYRAFRSSGMTDAAYAVWVTAADLLCNLNCYSSQLDFWLDEMAALQADGEEPSSDELSCRAAVCMHAGMSYRRPWHPDLAFWRDRALRLSQKLGRRDLQSLVYMHGLQEMACNASPDVGATADLMEKLLGGAKAPPVDQLRINFVKTALLMMEGQSERAISLARDCINYVDREGLVIHRPLLMYFQVRAYQNMGNVSAAALVISDFESYLSNLGTIFDTYFFVVKGIQDLLCGEFKQAAATLDLGVEMLGGDALTLAHFVTYFVRAQARSEAGQHEAAHADLAALFRMAECNGDAPPAPLLSVDGGAAGGKPRRPRRRAGGVARRAGVGGGRSALLLPGLAAGDPGPPDGAGARKRH